LFGRVPGVGRVLNEPATSLRSPAAKSVDDGALLYEEFERAQRIASGQIGAQDLDWLSKGFAAFLANGGALPLERCLRLPWKDGALRRACRDYWLRRAWKLVGPELSPWRRSEMLASSVRTFSSRQWVRWRGLQAPASDATELETALLHAFRACDRVPATAMQLHNIAHHRRHS
jgi:hypothetical protein